MMSSLTIGMGRCFLPELVVLPEHVVFAAHGNDELNFCQSAGGFELEEVVDPLCDLLLKFRLLCD